MKALETIIRVLKISSRAVRWIAESVFCGKHALSVGDVHFSNKKQFPVEGGKNATGPTPE